MAAAVSMLAEAASPAGVSLAATVDRTAVALGQTLTLTVTLAGDAGAIDDGPAFELPDGFVLASQRQASTLSIHGPAVQRSVRFEYTLIPTKIGMFRLGPVTVRAGGRSLTANPVKVQVSRPALPPHLQPQRRYTL